MYSLKNLINQEPVAIAATVRILLACALVFGLNWSAEQVAYVGLAVEAVLMLLTRSKVSPVTPSEE